MQRFKNILAVYGDDVGADDVLSHAVKLARTNSATLTVIDVAQERYTTLAQLSERRKRLDRLIPSLNADGVEDVAAIATVGAPFHEIIRQVLRGNHDLVIAGSAANTSLRSYFVGSTATHLMRKCPCPVWIVNPGQPTTYKRILACIDPPDEGTSSQEMDRKILDLGTSLAMRTGAELHVAHVWDVDGKDRNTISSEVPDTTMRSILAKHEGRHRAVVDGLLEKYGKQPPVLHTHLPRGSRPEWKILELVDELDADLIVMGTVCRTGVSGFFIGNAAESILSQVKCGVFTVKPEGFVSPIVLDAGERSFAA